MTAIDRTLQSHRDTAVTEGEKGTYFERPGLSFSLNEPTQTEEGIPNIATDFEGSEIDLINPWTAT